MSDQISDATFDILERLSREHPWLKGHYARGTGGVDVNTVVAVLWNDLTDARKATDAPPLGDAERISILEQEVAMIRSHLVL